MENEKKTKNILIVGNGFDLAHFLPTSYQDFLGFMQGVKILLEFKKRYPTALNNDLLFTIKKLFTEIILCKPEPLKNSFELNINFLNSKFAKFVNNFNLSYEIIDFKKFEIEFIINHFSDEINSQKNEVNFKKLNYDNIFENEWLSYFLTINSNLNWVDVEIELENILNILSKYINEYLKNYNTFNNYLNEETVLFYFFKNILEENHNENGSIYWRFKDEFYNDRVFESKLNFEKIINYLFESFNFFRFIFKAYIIEFVEKLTPFLKDGIWDCELYKYDFCYSFNYTNTAALCSKFNLGVVNHIHGSANSNFPIIFGVDINALKNEKNESLLIFSKQFQTLINSTEYIITPEKSLGNSYYIWGHSLGGADKNYLDQIINQLNLNFNNLSVLEIVDSQTTNSSMNKLVIYYYNNEAKVNYLKKLIHYYSYDLIHKLIKLDYLKFEKSPILNIRV